MISRTTGYDNITKISTGLSAMMMTETNFDVTFGHY